jgi:hypothetical protein
MFKTQHARAKKKGDFPNALELARGGAALMLEKGEVNAGSELARDYVELCKSDPIMDDEKYNVRIDAMVSLDNLFAKLPQNTEEVKRERKRYLKMCVDYSSLKGPWTYGDPKIHQSMALFHIKQSEFVTALKHLELAQRPEELATFLVSWAKSGSSSEYILHLTRVILQLLCLENLRDANIVYAGFRKALPETDEHPISHFLGFLLKVLERQAHPLFEQLRQKYSSHITRLENSDVPVNQYLDNIASVFYKVEAKRAGGGFDFLRSLLGGDQ